MAMLTVTGSISANIPYLKHISPLSKFINIISSKKPTISPISINNHSENLSSSFSSRGWIRIGMQHVPAKKWLCRMHDPSSPDDEYRSSRNIAISLFKRYRNVVERGGGDNLKEFIIAGVNSYALGCTDEGLRNELLDMKESGLEIESMQGFGGNIRLKSKIVSEEIDECILWLSIIFITILCTPQPTIVRWSSATPVSDEILLQWKGFCAFIANAYYIKGMAWLPVKTLQLEQMAVMGRAEEPSVVASRMRLVFSTLEVVSPQWPRV
ncbi:hypothetical protein SAY87_025297 [Trapa incisa]|uniref:DUF7876 domain-containing protein n=2 Tax=Trapa TaxID=22665 RepID=A0AAN7R5I2_TRANT|nr:hypothetical protein SAY87_025297 [Trapa incisa]KAK4788071.1 hypothetical protein SAY86_019390 [Trapa natans]